MSDETARKYLESLAAGRKHLHLCVICRDEWECANHLCDVEAGGVLTVYGNLDGCEKCCGLAVI